MKELYFYAPKLNEGATLRNLFASDTWFPKTSIDQNTPSNRQFTYVSYSQAAPQPNIYVSDPFPTLSIPTCSHLSLEVSIFFPKIIFNIPFIQTIIRSRPTLGSPNLNRSGERTGRLPRRPRELSGVGDGGVAGAS